MDTTNLTREEEQALHKAKYKANGKAQREDKAKANEPKYNEQGQKRVE